MLLYICIRSDNSSVVRFIKYEGGLYVYWRPQKKHFSGAMKYTFSSSYSKKNNVTADYFSRSVSNSTEWKLNENVSKEFGKHYFSYTVLMCLIHV